MQRAATEVATEPESQAEPGQGTAVASEGKDHERVARLFDEHYDFVWRLLRRLGVPAAVLDDAAQQTFIIAARKLGQIAAGSERSFLHGVAIRVAADARDSHGRKSGRAGTLDSDAPSAMPAPDELLDRKRARERLDQILAGMSLEERTVFVLYELEGLTMAEIAELERIPPGTVASRLRRARETFTTKLGKLFPRQES